MDQQRGQNGDKAELVISQLRGSQAFRRYTLSARERSLVLAAVDAALLSSRRRACDVVDEVLIAVCQVDDAYEQKSDQVRKFLKATRRQNKHGKQRNGNRADERH